MKLEKLESMLDDFLESKELSAILIDGKWGIGKTYAVTQYFKKRKLERKNKNERVAYSTLFGKKDLAEVNTELYNCLAGKKGKLLKVASSVVKVVELGSKCAGFYLKLGSHNISNKKRVKANKNTTVCIIDDLERKNHESIKTDEVIGYLNNLVLQGIKVICLTHSKHMDEEARKGLDAYKEKVIDRIYTIESSNSEAYRHILGDNYKYYEHSEFLENKNLRSYIRANILFNEIVKKAKIDNGLDTLFAICLVVVEEDASMRLESEYKKYEMDEKRKNPNGYVFPYSFERSVYDLFAKNGKTVNTSYVKAVNDIYIRHDYDLLEKLISPQENDELSTRSVLRHLYMFSQEDLPKQIKLQERYILERSNKTKESMSILSDIFRMWFSKEEDKDIESALKNIDMDAIFKKLASVGFQFSHFDMQGRAIKVAEEYEPYVLKQHLEDMTMLAEKEQDKKDVIRKMYSSGFTNNYKHNSRDDENTKKILSDTEKGYLDIFKDKDFFVTDIHGTMTEDSWDTAHSVCRFAIVFPKIKDSLKKYLQGYIKKHKEDKRLKQRIDHLIEQYKLG